MPDRKIYKPASNIARQVPAICGGMGDDGLFYYQSIDSNGNTTVISSPFIDIDTTFSYNGDGTIAQIVMTSSSQTKTLVFSYGGGNLTSIACVIT